MKRLAGRFDDTFVVVSGDALTDVNLRSWWSITGRKAPWPR